MGFFHSLQGAAKLADERAMSGSQVGYAPNSFGSEARSNDSGQLSKSSQLYHEAEDPSSAGESFGVLTGAEDHKISFLQKPLGPFAFGVLYSAVLNITAIIGAGILALPHAVASFHSLPPGILFLVISLAVTYFSLWQLVEMHEEEIVNEDGVSTVVTYDRYQDLAKRAGGERGKNVVAVLQLVVFVGVTIVYMVTGGLSLLNVYRLLACDHHGPCKAPHPVIWITVFSSAQYILSQRHGFTALFYLSLVAAVMSLSYTSIIVGATIAARHVPFPPPPVPSPPVPPPVPTSAVWDGFTGLGTIAFAYAGHNVVLEIQSSIPTSPRMRSSKLSMLWGVTIAYLVVGVCYLAVAISGYKVFGQHAAANVLGTFAYGGCCQRSLAMPSLTKYKGWTVAANIMVAVHLTGTYQIFAMPVYLLLEKSLKEKSTFFARWSNSTIEYQKFSYRIVVRCAYVFFTFLMAILLPDFYSLLGILGGFAFSPTTYFLPCLIWLRIYKSKPWSRMWTVCWGICVFGVIVMVLALLGSSGSFIITVTKNYTDYWSFSNGCQYCYY